MSYRHCIQSNMHITEDDKYGIVSVADIIRGEIVIITEGWWMIIGDDLTQKRYDLLKSRFTPGISTKDRNTLFEEINNIK